jgi:hypothetical protein
MSETPQNPLPPINSGGGSKLPSGRTLGREKRPLSGRPDTKRFGNLEPTMRPKVLIIGVIFLLLMLSSGWYFLIKKPIDERNRAAEMEMKAAEEARKAAEIKLQSQQIEVSQQKSAQARGMFTVKTVPAGATVTLDDGAVLKSPATFKSIKVGSHKVKIALEGYEVVNLEAVVKEDQSNDLDVVNLIRSVGALSIQSSQAGVDYVVKETDKTVASGRVPAVIKNLPTGDYAVIVRRGDFELNLTAAVVRNDTVQCRAEFGYATVQISSTPPGATVKLGDKELGVTPATLTEIRPGDATFQLVLAGYKTQNVSAKLEASKTTMVSASLELSHDFTNAAGMEMVWIAPAGFWSGKYEVLQGEYEKVMGYRAGTFAGARRPVETVSWTDAATFCKKLTDLDRKTGKLPAGYIYNLPTESQWETLTADASLDDAVTSSGDTDRSGTEVAGNKKPNKYGIYDTRGNVWEWMSTLFDGNSQRHVIRGASWLSSKSNTLDFSYREGAPENYRDRTIGFRCVLVKE